MAVTETLTRSSVSLKLNAGLSPSTGNMLTQSCSLGKIAGDADAEKILIVAEKLAPLLSNPLVRVERTAVSILEGA